MTPIIAGVTDGINMSYSISLIDPVTKEVLTADNPHFIRGGYYAMNGTSDLWLNVTYNYSGYFYKYIDEEKGIRAIYGMTGAESIPILQDAISKLKDDATNRYWDATEGNAKRALSGLVALAQMRPDGIWDGD